jgi:hypothetical protein
MKYHNLLIVQGYTVVTSSRLEFKQYIVFRNLSLSNENKYRLSLLEQVI